MPSEAQIEFFARWNAAAQRADRSADLATTMADRLAEAARLSAVATEVSEATLPDADAQRA